MAVIVAARHPGVAIPEEVDVLQTEVAGCAAQFGLAHLSDRCMSLHVFVIHGSHLPTGGAHQVDVVTLAGVESQGAAQTERFIIRMGQDCQYGIGHC
jgi:hypothetical protein